MACAPNGALANCRLRRPAALMSQPYGSLGPAVGVKPQLLRSSRQPFRPSAAFGEEDLAIVLALNWPLPALHAKGPPKAQMYGRLGTSLAAESAAGRPDGPTGLAGTTARQSAATRQPACSRLPRHHFCSPSGRLRHLDTGRRLGQGDVLWLRLSIPAGNSGGWCLGNQGK